MLQKYSTIAYLQKRLANSRPLYDVPENKASIGLWRQAAATRLRELFGIDESVPVPLDARVEKPQQRDGYTIQHIIFSAEEYVDVPGWLLIPDGVSANKPAPAVLCIHGGVPGAKDEVAGELQNPMAAKGYAAYGDDFARQFVKERFIAFTIDLRNFGERKEKFVPDLYGLNNDAKYNQVLAMNAIFHGQTFFGLHLFDCMRALDYLLTRPEVNIHAVGAAGFSFGGNTAVWLAALDRRIKVVGMEGNCPSWRRTMTFNIDSVGYNKGRPFHLLPGIVSQMTPRFLRDLDMNLSLALAAPTPMIISNEYESWAFKNLEEAKADARLITDVYQAFNAPDNIHIEYVKGKHRWRQEVIVPWMSNRLRALSGAAAIEKK